MKIKVCRICGRKDNLKHVLDGGAELLEMLRICANISITLKDDGMPQELCIQCEQGLKFSYQLRKQGEETEKRLRQELLAETKEEDITQEQIVEEINEETNVILDNVDIIDDDMKIESVVESCALLEEQHIKDENILEIFEAFEDTKPEAESDDYIVLDDDDDANNVEMDLVEEIVESPEQPICSENEFESDSSFKSTIEQCTIDLLNEQYEEIQEERNQAKKSSLKLVAYMCDTCQQVLPSQTEYRLHIKQHGNERFNCIQCNKWFPTRFRLQNHERCHDSDVEMHQCPQCERAYRSRLNLERHIRSAHDDIRQYACSLCPQSFGRADVLKTHMTSHQQERIFICDYCEKSFKTKRYLSKHLKIHQLDKDDSEKQQKTKRGYESNNSADSVPKKTYYCAHCGKISNHSFTHKNHLRTHSKERPYTCDTCQKSFRTLAAMITHERIHTDLRPYQCEHCLASFRQQSHLKDHKMLHEGTMPHVCSVCQMSFSKKSNMVVHMRIHSGERPYKCASCDHQFAFLSQLKRHAATQHAATITWERKDVDELIEQDKQERDAENVDDEKNLECVSVPTSQPIYCHSFPISIDDLNTLPSAHLVGDFVGCIGAEETAIELIIDSNDSAKITIDDIILS